MEDQKILEERTSIKKSIKQKMDEWDAYNKRYAGSAGFANAQNMFHNEIMSLQADLFKLPLTTVEKRNKIIKWMIGGVVVAAVVLILIRKIFF